MPGKLSQYLLSKEQEDEECDATKLIVVMQLVSKKKIICLKGLVSLRVHSWLRNRCFM
jgi:hypothetical protein